LPTTYHAIYTAVNAELWKSPAKTKCILWSRHVAYEKVDANCSSSQNCTYMRTETLTESVDDATAGMIIVFMLFIIPSSLSFWPFVQGSYSLYILVEATTKELFK
jgi:hypothetical protein